MLGYLGTGTLLTEPNSYFLSISQVPAPALAMNAKPISGKVNPFHSHMIREIGGIRVGLTGWTYPFVDQTMPPSFSEGLDFFAYKYR